MEALGTNSDDKSILDRHRQRMLDDERRAPDLVFGVVNNGHTTLRIRIWIHLDAETIADILRPHATDDNCFHFAATLFSAASDNLIASLRRSSKLPLKVHETRRATAISNSAGSRTKH